MRLLAPLLIALASTVAYGTARLGAHREASTISRVAALAPTPEQRRAMEDLVFPLLSDVEPSTAELATSRQGLLALNQELLDETARLAADEAVQLVLWSEAAVPVFARDEPALRELARARAVASGIHLGLALAAVDDDFRRAMAEARPFLRNGLILFSPSGEVLLEHYKSILVPGEETMITRPGDGAFGSAATPLGTLASAICFELDFAGPLRALGRGETQGLLVPANDWPAIRNSHAAMARFRAVENGIGLLRATSNGISFACDACGRASAESDWLETEGRALVAAWSPGRAWALYPHLGDALAWSCLAASAVFLVLALRRRRRKTRPPQTL